MCGICGVASEHNEHIQEMVNALKHRGPDSQGIWENQHIALGHTRLSILDLNERSSQPMQSPNGRYILSYNGEIYNFPELKQELIKNSYSFKTESDTEVILLGFEFWGFDLFEKLNGMFAFAILDTHKELLYLVRDRFGIKPLYYSNTNKGFSFSSELESLLMSKTISRKMNYQGLHEYLHFQTTLGSQTFYDGVFKLEPGKFLTFDLKARSIKIRTFAKIPDRLPSTDTFEEASHKVKSLLRDSVKRQLLSDVPVGVFLSGGIDSTAITAFASESYSGKLKTFSAGFDFDKGVNELPRAKYISQVYDTDHHEFHISGNDVTESLETLSQNFGQPFSDAANLPLFLMSKEVYGKSKVILQGDGGDELFAGYNQYVRAKYSKSFTLLSNVATKFGSLIPKESGNYRKLRSMYAFAQKDKSLIPARTYSSLMFNENPLLFFKKGIQEQLKETNPFIRHKHFHEQFKDLDLLQEMLYTDMNIILPDQYFEKVDRATMANSIEVRVPFLDNELVSYATSLPSKYKIKNRDKKHLLKHALKDVVPHDILYGKKYGFSVPFGHWLKTSLSSYLMENIEQTSCYSPRVKRMAEAHISGKEDNSYTLWKLLNFSIWLKNNPGICFE